MLDKNSTAQNYTIYELNHMKYVWVLFFRNTLNQVRVTILETMKIDIIFFKYIQHIRTLYLSRKHLWVLVSSFRVQGGSIGHATLRESRPLWDFSISDWLTGVVLQTIFHLTMIVMVRLIYVNIKSLQSFPKQNKEPL